MEKKLLKYIKKTKKQGFSDEEIRKTLLGAGWKEKDINEGFKTIDKAKPRSRLKWLVIIVVIVVVVGIVGVVVAFNFEMIKSWFVKSEEAAEEQQKEAENVCKDWKAYQNLETGRS